MNRLALLKNHAQDALCGVGIWLTYVHEDLASFTVRNIHAVRRDRDLWRLPLILGVSVLMDVNIVLIRAIGRATGPR